MVMRPYKFYKNGGGDVADVPAETNELAYWCVHQLGWKGALYLYGVKIEDVPRPEFLRGNVSRSTTRERPTHADK